MANVIRIKRRLTSVAPASLEEGEMAMVFGSGDLYIGAPSNTMILIAGSSFAKISSPTFTGTPTAPTPADNTTTTRVATTGYVSAAIAAAGAGAHDHDDRYYTETEMNGFLNLKAPLASPALTGTPTAPTPANSTNTTQLATTAYVKAVIADLVNGASTSLDTLNELAAALGNDANFASTINTALGVRLITTNNLSDLTNVATARTNLGLGSMATQNANAVAITGGTIDGTVIDGGTF